MAKARLSFRNLLNYFPKIELPVHLTDETHHLFSRENKILPEDFVYTFLVEEEELDPYTEYLPCFRLDHIGDIIGLVVWRASLMDYSYILYTFNPKNTLIAQQVIAGTKSNGETLLTRQSIIDQEGTIAVIEGLGDANGNYDPSTSKSFQFEILDSGDILQIADPLDN